MPLLLCLKSHHHTQGRLHFLRVTLSDLTALRLTFRSAIHFRLLAVKGSKARVWIPSSAHGHPAAPAPSAGGADLVPVALPWLLCQRSTEPISGLSLVLHPSVCLSFADTTLHGLLPICTESAGRVVSTLQREFGKNTTSVLKGCR